MNRSIPDAPTNLVEDVFLVLRAAFFNDEGEPISYPLRAKGGTQDDPLDEYMARLLRERLPSDIVCQKSPGPLINPDLVVMRPALCSNVPREELAHDLTRIIAIEVKKLDRKITSVARGSGMDFNSTPPCGIVHVYDDKDMPLHIRSFYLFVVQEPATELGTFFLSALLLCDGNALNEDRKLYQDVVGERTKMINLGSYGDGANRLRPMMIFANPLKIPVLDRSATVILSDPDPSPPVSRLRRVGTISREIFRKQGDSAPTQLRRFGCYRIPADIPATATEFDLQPFRTPRRREQTQGRGRFKINIRPS